MHEALNRNLFLVKEHVGMFKAANNYDVYEPETGRVVMHSREPRLGGITKVLRFTEQKTLTPFDIRITTPDGEPLVRVTRGWAFIRSKVQVFDERDEYMGTFRQRLLSLGGAFDLIGPNDEVLCSLRGRWTSWNFRFLVGEAEVAHVTKKWAGVGRELFTSADNYILEIDDDVPRDHPLRPLILAAVMCIDMVLKEK